MALLEHSGETPGGYDVGRSDCAEVRRTREKIFAEFDYDLEAYVEHLKRVQQEKQGLGVRYLDSPLPSPISMSESDAR